MEDKTVIPPKIPFQLKLRPMLCYREWKKTSGQPSEHIVSLKKAVKQAAAKSKDLMEEEFGDIGRQYTERDNSGKIVIETQPQLDECTTEHFVYCPSTDPRPTVFRQDYD